MTIREVRPEDLNEILLHRREMFFDMGQSDEAALEKMTETSRSFVKRCLEDGSYLGWFGVDDGGRVVAGVGLLITPWVSGPQTPDQTHRAYLLNVYTAPEYRNQGLARKLTTMAIEWCAANGFKRLWLHASDRGRRVYEALGFRSTNEMMLRIAP